MPAPAGPVSTEQAISGGGAAEGARSTREAKGRAAPRRRLLGVALLVVVGALCWLSWRQLWLKSQLAAARESLRQGDFEAATARLGTVAARSPQSAEAEYLLGAALRRAGRIEQVETHLARAAELGWNSKDLDRQRCLTFFQVGDYRTSGAELLELLLEDANDDEAEETYEALTRGYTTGMLLNQANFILDGWIRWRPESVRAWLMRAEVAALSGNVKGEIAAYREILHFEPKHLEARQRLAYALSQSLQGEEAHKVYAELLRERPNDPEVLYGLAEWHHRHSEIAQANQLLAKVLELSPDARQRAAALGLLGKIALAEKDYPMAVQWLQHAVEAEPGSIPANYALSRALSGAGREKDAKTYLERYQRLQDLEDELQELRDALIARPEDTDLRSRIGESLLEMGEANSGVNWLLSVLFRDPSHERTHRLLAAHFEKIGETELAQTHLAIANGKLQYRAVPIRSPAMARSQDAP